MKIYLIQVAYYVETLVQFQRKVTNFASTLKLYQTFMSCISRSRIYNWHISSHGGPTMQNNFMAYSCPLVDLEFHKLDVVTSLRQLMENLEVIK